MTDPTPGTPFTIRDNIISATAQILGVDGRDLTLLYGRLQGILEQTTNTAAQVNFVGLQMDPIKEALGAEPYDALNITTIRGLLYAILNRLTILALGAAPDNGGDYVSRGDMVLGGRRYAIFPNPIEGVEISSDRRQLTRSTWEGWEYYAQTTDPTPWANDVPMVPNAWTPMTLWETWNWSVLPQYQITVYLRNTIVIPDEPVLLWSGSEATHTAGLWVEAPTQQMFFVVELPNWADRIQVRTVTTSNFGNGVFISTLGTSVGGYSGGNQDTTIAIPVGAERFGVSGSSGEPWFIAGSVWALAPGVAPVP